jgi:hypothetical protein
MKKLFSIPGNGLVIIMGKEKDAGTVFCTLCAIILFGAYFSLILFSL